MIVIRQQDLFLLLILLLLGIDDLVNSFLLSYNQKLPAHPTHTAREYLSPHRYLINS